MNGSGSGNGSVSFQCQRRICSSEERAMFETLKNNMENEVYIAEHELAIPTIYLDGREDPKKNVDVIKTKVLKIGGLNV